MTFYLVTVGSMFVQGYKMDPVTGKPMYVKLNPRSGFARLISNREEALDVASYINGSIVAFVENEKEEI